jgi:hypothetical protein
VCIFCHYAIQTRHSRQAKEKTLPGKGEKEGEERPSPQKRRNLNNINSPSIFAYSPRACQRQLGAGANQTNIEGVDIKYPVRINTAPLDRKYPPIKYLDKKYPPRGKAEKGR